MFSNAQQKSAPKFQAEDAQIERGSPNRPMQLKRRICIAHAQKHLIFRLALNLPNSRLLAPGPSHYQVQLGSWTDPHGAVQHTQDLNRPLRFIQAISLDHGVRLGTQMLHFRVYAGLGSAQLSGLEYTLATSLADAGIILFHLF